MPRRRSKRRHVSTAEWGIRGAVSLVAALLGLTSVSSTLANVVAKVDPARAHDLAPSNGHITAAAAEQAFTLAPDAASESEAAKRAELALRQDATAVGALSVLGLQAQLRSEVERARELFGYSHRLSRRELRTQIWAIEEAVARGDIAGALEQYDRALRTSNKARQILFPVLARAIAEPAVRAELLEMMAAESTWRDAFVRYVAANAPEPEAVVAFFRRGASVDLPVKDEDRSRLVNALMAKGATDDAWSFYASFRQGTDRSLSRDADFTMDVEIPSVFDWTTFNPDGVSTSIQRGEEGGVVYFNASSGAGGTALRQTQLLTPGDYRLEGRSLGVEQPKYSRPYWVLTCRDGRELGRVLLPNSGDSWETFTGRFNVPAGCSVQTLALVIRASDDIAGVQGRIDNAQLAPAP